MRLTTDFTKAERSEALTGGAGTVEKIGKNSYSHHFTTLTFEDRQNFHRQWSISANFGLQLRLLPFPSDGLGPIYNARACQSCHIKDGRGHLPETEKPLSLVIKVGKYQDLNLLPSNKYGKQFQFFAIPGMSSEVNGSIIKNKFITKLHKNYELASRSINFNIDSLAFGEIKKNKSLSLRISPQGYGVGLVEAIEVSDILMKADINDLDNDGISGIARMVKNELGQML